MRDPGPYKSPPTSVGRRMDRQGAVNTPPRQVCSIHTPPTIAGDARLEGSPAFTRI
jgi:hypothetical protein